MSPRIHPIKFFHLFCVELLMGAFLGYAIYSFSIPSVQDEKGTIGIGPKVVEVVHKEVAKADSTGTPGDADGDGLPDTWETTNALNPNSPDDASSDFDQDGLSALQEYQNGKNPLGKWKLTQIPAPSGFVSSPSMSLIEVTSNGTALVRVQGTLSGASSATAYPYTYSYKTGIWTRVSAPLGYEATTTLNGLDVNSKGEVVGYFTSGTTLGFIWSEAGGVWSSSLYVLDSVPSGATPAFPKKISDGGYIVGNATTFNGRSFAADEDRHEIQFPGAWTSPVFYDVNDYGEFIGSVLNPLTNLNEIFVASEGFPVFSTAFGADAMVGEDDPWSAIPDIDPNSITWIEPESPGDLRLGTATDLRSQSTVWIHEGSGASLFWLDDWDEDGNPGGNSDTWYSLPGFSATLGAVNSWGEFAGLYSVWMENSNFPETGQEWVGSGANNGTFFFDGSYHLANVGTSIMGLSNDPYVLVGTPYALWHGPISVPLTKLVPNGTVLSFIQIGKLADNGVLFLQKDSQIIRTLALDQDEDHDGMPDDWEDIHGLNKSSAADATTDPDGDGTNNLGEFLLRSDPNVAPAIGENGEEIDVRPGVDTDGDGIPNVWEWQHGLDYLDPADALLDLDRDGYTNLQEYQLNTDPFGAPHFEVHEAGPFQGATLIDWSAPNRLDDEDRLLMQGHPVTGYPARLWWEAGQGIEEPASGWYPPAGSANCPTIAFSDNGAAFGAYGTPATLVYWASPTAVAVTKTGTDTRNIIASSCQLSPSGTWLAGWRTVDSTGAVQPFALNVASGSSVLQALTVPAGVAINAPQKLMVNDFGHVVGAGTLAGKTRGLHWSPGSGALLASVLPLLPGGDTANPVGLSNSQQPQIAGSGNATGTISRAMVWSHLDVATDLGVLGSDVKSAAVAISPAGVICGWSDTGIPSTSSQQVFVATPKNGSWRLRAQGERHAIVRPSKVNNGGEVLGTIFEGGFPRPVLWRAGREYPLEHIIPESSEFKLASILDINAAGSLLATGVRGGYTARLILTTDADTDGDGMSDVFETAWGLQQFDASDGALDPDQDGLTSAKEFLYSSDPTNRDTDGDGIDDGWEVKWGFDPTDEMDADLDPDGDKLSNLIEFQIGTSPVGLYRVESIPLASGEYIQSAGADGSLLLRRDTSPNGYDTVQLLPAATPGGSRTEVQMVGANGVTEVGDMFETSESYYRAGANGKVCGLFFFCRWSDDYYGGQELTFFTSGPAAGDNTWTPWSEVEPSWISGGFLSAPIEDQYSIGFESSQEGLYNLFEWEGRYHVLNSQGVHQFELPKDISSLNVTGVTWSIINDHAEVLGTDGEERVFCYSQGSISEILLPAGLNVSWIYPELFSNDGLAVVTCRTLNPDGTAGVAPYLVDTRNKEFKAIKTSGYSSTERVISIAEGGKILGVRGKPWVVLNGATIRLEGLLLTTGAPNATPVRLDQMNWTTFTPIHISKDGTITGDISSPSGHAAVQLHPANDADGDGMADDWEIYWAKYLVHSNPSLATELASGNLDPQRDYRGNGAKAYQDYLASNLSENEEDEEDDVGVFFASRLRHVTGLFGTDSDGTILGDMTAGGFPAIEGVPSSKTIYAEELQASDITLQKIFEKREAAYPWEILDFERDPAPVGGGEFMLLHGSHQIVPGAYQEERFNFSQGQFTIGRGDPIAYPTKRTFIELRKEVGYGQTLLNPNIKKEIVALHSFTIPPGATWANERPDNFLVTPEADALAGMDLDPIRADLEVLSPDLAVASPEGPPSHRKISLGATPAKDASPEGAPESDTPREEAYVDAYDRSLSFNTSLIWLDQGSSELPLGVTLSYNPTPLKLVKIQTLDPRTKKPNGFKEVLAPGPMNQGTGFGAGLSSNLCAGLVARANITSFKDKQGISRSRIKNYDVDVIDSDGVPHKFTSPDLRYFSAIPGPVRAAEGQSVSLSWNSDHTYLVLAHKFGKKCWFKWGGPPPTFVNPSRGPGIGTGLGADELGVITTDGSAGLEKVTDQFGNRIEYASGTIKHFHVNSSTPSAEIHVERSGDLVTAITDPRGKTTRFKYATATVGKDIKLPVLSEIIQPDGGVRRMSMHLDFRRPKTYNPKLGPPDPRDPFSTLNTRPKKKKKWIAGDSVEGSVAPYLMSIQDASGRSTTFTYTEPTTIDAAKRVIIVGKVDFGDYAGLDGATLLNEALKNTLIHDAKLEASEDITAEMAMRGFFKSAVSEDVENTPPGTYNTAEGVYYRTGLTSSPAVEKVVRSDVDGDGAPEVMWISQEDHMEDYFASSKPPFHNDEDWLKGVPPNATVSQEREAKFLRKTVVSDGKGSSSFTFGDAMVVGQGIPETEEPGDQRDPDIMSTAKIPEELKGLPIGTHTVSIIVRHLEIERSVGGSNGTAKESYYFDPTAGMALAGSIDASGNSTTYDYTEGMAPPPAGVQPTITIGGRPFASLQQFKNHPNVETRKKGNVRTGLDGAHVTRNFKYDGELQVRLVDEKGYVTLQKLDDAGHKLRIWEKAYASETAADDPNAAPLKWEEFSYGNALFPSFVTEHRIKKLGTADPTWVNDMVTQYEADDKGRLWKEKVVVSPTETLTTVHTYDENGNKKTITTPRGLTTTFAYDDMNRIATITYQDGATKRFEYDSSGRKTAEINERGNRTSYKYTSGGFLKEVRVHMADNEDESPDDLVTRTVYDSRGRALSVTDPNGNTTTTEYDGLDRPVKVRNAAGGETLFAYDLTKNPGGAVFNSSSFKPTRTRDARGYITEVTYDYRYMPVKVAKEYELPTGTLGDWKTRALGLCAVTETVYDNVGNATDTYVKRSASDALESDDVMHTEVAYDALGRAYKTTVEPDGSSPLRHETETFFTSTGLSWKTTEFQNVATLKRSYEKEYDGAGRMIKEWSPAPANGNVVKATSVGPLVSPLVQTAYDQDGNVVTVTDPLGYDVKSYFDIRNRKWKEEGRWMITYENLGASPAIYTRPTTITAYDAAGNVETVTDPLGVVTKTIRDRANRVTHVYAAIGEAEQTVTSTQYDKNGNVIALTDPNGNTTRNSYDVLNRLIGTSVNPANGNPAWPLSPNSGDIVTANVYDAAGNLLEVADGAAAKNWSTDHWTFSNRAAGHVTAFRYDGLNRKLATVWDSGSSLAHEEKAEYDAAVQTKRIDAVNRKTCYAYDGLFRLTTTSYDGSPAEDNTRYYKGGASFTASGPGPLQGVFYGAGTDGTGLRDVAYSMDRLDRITTESSGGATHYYTYDRAGNRLAAAYCSRAVGSATPVKIRILISVYDYSNRVVKIHETTNIGASVYAYSPAPGDLTTEYAYDLAGRIRFKSLPNGQRTTTSYDKLGRTMLINTIDGSGNPVARFDYSTREPGVLTDPSGYDNAGNVRHVVETCSDLSARTVTNDYDSTHRLIRESAVDGTKTVITEYAYDKANNRTVKDVFGGSDEGTWAFTYGTIANGANSNQLVSYNRPSDGAIFTFEYDLLGNRSKRNKKMAPGATATLDIEYSYDRENRLVKYKSHDAAGRDDDYSYDFRSRRVARDESGSLDGHGSSVELSFSGGTSVQEYVPGAAMPAAEHMRGSDWGGGVGGILYSRRGGAASFCAYNSRGDVVSRTDASGNVTWQGSYEAFGTRTESFGSSTERQTANTKDEDFSSLLNEGMRYRDLEAGVFLTRDPAGFVDGPNVYTYVRQNPWSCFDPDGLHWTSFSSLPGVEQQNPGFQRAEIKSQQAASAGMISGGIKAVTACLMTFGSWIQGKPIADPTAVGQAFEEIDKSIFDSCDVDPEFSGTFQFSSDATVLATAIVSEGMSSVREPSQRSVNNQNRTLRRLTAQEKKTYGRVSLRKDTKVQMWEKAMGPDGKVRDPETGIVLKWEEPWVAGHKPDFEFRKAQRSAADRKITREEWIEEQNNPSLYRPEKPATSAKGEHETPDDSYRGDSTYEYVHENIDD